MNTNSHHASVPISLIQCGTCVKPILASLLLCCGFAASSALATGWQTVPLGGGGFVTGLLAHPTVGGPIYCRTDVGGAFRWDAANVQWKSISDAIVSGTTFGAANLMGTESIAVDLCSGNQNKVYIAAGVSASPTNGPCGIYVTNDSSVASPVWTAISGSTIAVASNPSDSSGKVYGERLGVDPNNSNIIYYGSNKSGLYRGVSSGTWAWSTVAGVPVGDAVVGVSFVAFDKDGGTTTVNGQVVSKYIYAGVYNTNVTGSSGVYRSSDGGVTWSQMLLSSTTPTLTRPYRGEVDGDGNLYVTHNVGTTGYVAKLTRGGATMIPSITGTTLGARNLCGLAVDPTRNAGGYFPVMVSEYTTGINIWRSVNGGSNWVLMNKTRHSTEPDGTPSLSANGWQRLADLMITPGNPSEVWTCDFTGVIRTQNIKDDTTASDWYRVQVGQEELCVQALKNAPTEPARLMVGVADLNGFQYDDVSLRPDFTSQDPGHDVFTNPSAGNTTSLDFCESYQNVWARTWVDSSASFGSGGVSIDSGRTWLSFGEIDCKTVINSGTAGWESWDLSTYLSAQRAKGVDTVTLVLHSSNTPDRSTNILQFDSNNAVDTDVRPKLVLSATTLNPTADSYVAAGSGTSTNYGSSAVLQVSYAYSEGSSSRWTYLKFDLRSVSAITSATLQLHRVSSANTTQFPVHVYGCSNTSWGETTITWNNRPATLAGSDPIYAPNYGLMGGRIAISATNPNLMVWVPIGITNYPRFSKDRGVTWTSGTGAPVSQIQDRFYPSTLIQPLAADRANGKFYYMKLGGVSGGNHAIYTSTNSGANWVLSGTVPTSTYNAYRAQLVAAPAADDLWVCDDGVSGATAGGLWHSTNGGTTWAKLLPGTIRAVREVSFGKAQSGSGYTVFINGYKNGVNGVWRSDDYGATWVNLGLPTIAPVDALAGDRQNYGGVFIGTGGRGTFYFNPGPTNVVLGDIADSYVQQTTPTTNYGTSTSLVTKNDAAITRYTYLKFDMSGCAGSIVSGTLWLNMAAHGTLDMPVAVYACSNTSWIESGTGSITWNNRPATTGSPLATTTVYVADPIGSWYTWDVTSYLQQQKNAGIDIVTLVLVNTIQNAGNSGITFNSDEAGGSVIPKLDVNYQFP